MATEARDLGMMRSVWSEDAIEVVSTPRSLPGTVGSLPGDQAITAERNIRLAQLFCGFNNGLLSTSFLPPCIQPPPWIQTATG